MEIDFYHIDAFELANFLPIWDKLRNFGVNARLVAVPGRQNTASTGWFDFEKFKSYCVERNIEFSTIPNYSADLAITTQSAHILSHYKRKVRLMYGPVMYPQAGGLRLQCFKNFDAILVHGPAYVEQFSRWLPRKRLFSIGYPRFDNFFLGKSTPQRLRSAFSFDNTYPVVGFFPTWKTNTAFDSFFGAVQKLSHRFNFVLRPHHCTVRMEPGRMARMKSSGLPILDGAFDLVTCYSGIDIFLGDVRSCSLMEACLCDIPAVGMVPEQSDVGWLQSSGVSKMVELCADPNRLEQALERSLSDNYSLQRKKWADHHVAFRDGTASQHAAEALVKIAKMPLWRTKSLWYKQILARQRLKSISHKAWIALRHHCV